MLVPFKWLKEMTPYEGNAEALGDALTMRGLELEEIINPFASIMGIKVGFVAECTDHPNSDHLHCCKVDMGDDTLLDIVCGAPNVAEGQKVAVAVPGTRMPDGTVIKKTKLRGQPSCGMICSERELQLSEDHTGIMVLPESADVGHYLVNALDMDTEVLNISITPNRPDCLSILGIARETAAAFNLPLHLPTLPIIENFQLPHREVPVEIEDPDLCWLYTGRVIAGLTVAPAPMRMRYRLLAAGVRSVSNIVDVTNYVLFECGQPLHAFDLDKLADDKIIVRTAKNGEHLETLDGKKRKLDKHDLCICDGKEPIGLAGVMGGLNTAIDDSTRNVFLESAVFQPHSIRLTSRKLGLVSEASYRFERGVDQQRTGWALDRAASLIASIGGGNVLHGFSVKEPRPFRPKKISFSPQKASDLLGVEISSEFQKNTLQSLGCAVETDSSSHWTVIQPSWRPDLTREADMIEEVGRCWGLDKIEPELPPVRHKLDEFVNDAGIFSFLAKIKKWGAGLGLHEAVNYSFVGAGDLDRLNVEKENRIMIFNPLSEDQNVLRTCLAPGLLNACANNLAFEAQSIRMFEVANAFTAHQNSESKVLETPLLGILLCGYRFAQNWPHKKDPLDYQDIKGCCENLLSFLHLYGESYGIIESHPYFSPAVSINLNGDQIGVLGCLKQEIASLWKIDKPVWMAELNLEQLWNLNKKAQKSFVALPVFPAVRRDMTISADPSLKVQEILDAILAMKIPVLEGAVLADMYQPENMRERNLTFRLTFRHSARTLKDAEVDKEREKIADFLRKKYQATI